MSTEPPSTRCWWAGEASSCVNVCAEALRWWPVITNVFGSLKIRLIVQPLPVWRVLSFPSQHAVGRTRFHLDVWRPRREHVDGQTAPQVQRCGVARQLVHHRQHPGCFRRRQQGKNKEPVFLFFSEVPENTSFTESCPCVQVTLWKESMDGQWACISDVSKGQGAVSTITDTQQNEQWHTHTHTHNPVLRDERSLN